MIACGQVIRKNDPVTLVTAARSAEREGVSVVGPLCTPLCKPLDLLADKTSLPVADLGDMALIYPSRAHGASASPQAFPGHPARVEVRV